MGKYVPIRRTAFAARKGILIAGPIGIPEWRYFFAASVLVGSVVAYFLYRRHQVL